MLQSGISWQRGQKFAKSDTVVPGYQIERSVFELNRTQPNENQTIKFDVVRSSNEIELTKNKCESNQIERSKRFDEVRLVLSPNDT